MTIGLLQSRLCEASLLQVFTVDCGLNHLISPGKSQLSSVHAADSRKMSSLPKHCRYSGFEEFVLLSWVNLSYRIGILGWGSSFSFPLLPLCRKCLFHPSLPVWRTSSSHGPFVFHPDNKLSSLEAVKFFPLIPPVPVHHGTVDPAELHPARLTSCHSSLLSEIF